MIKSRKMRWEGYVARMGRRMNIGYWWGSQKKRPLGRPRRTRRWVGNVKMDFREIGWGGMNWMIWLRVGTSGGFL
jgi:hypothetical protein